MKKTGTKFEYSEQRNANLLAVYRRKLYESKVIRLSDVLRETVNTQSERFWVSEERAVGVVMKMIKGDTLKDMSPMKREMFTEIYRRVMEEKKQAPHKTITDIVTHIVNCPAPKFYLTPGSAKVIIHNIKKGKR